MMWIHFTQQEAFDYLPLRWGLKYIKDKTAKEVNAIIKSMGKCTPHIPELCPKIFTTRLKPLKPHLTYTVVKGSRYKVKPVEPKIVFNVEEVFELDLQSGVIRNKALDFVGDYSLLTSSLYPHNLSYPELDLGFKGATFDNLIEVLLDLNKKATLDTPFYVNRLQKHITSSLL